MFTKRITVLLSLLAVVFLSGCAASQMREATSQEVYTAKNDKALVYFVRPSMMGAAVTSALWDVSLDGSQPDEFIGLLGGNSKVAFYAEPGEHLFMVTGENADFMRAYLEAGKSYYVLNTVRMGVWMARFSVKPIHQDKIGTPEFKEWVEDATLLVNTPESQAWAKENYDSEQSLKEDYIKKWEAKSAADKNTLTLRKTDGVK